MSDRNTPDAWSCQLDKRLPALGKADVAAGRCSAASYGSDLARTYHLFTERNPILSRMNCFDMKINATHNAPPGGLAYNYLNVPY